MLRRFVTLFAGLGGMGLSLALLVRAQLGLDPWDVLNQGVARHMGIQLGWAVDIIGAVVLLAWIPLRQRPGVGTLFNVVVVGLIVNWVLDVTPSFHALPARVAVLGAAIVLNAVSTGCYIGAGLGPGPRDGLMTGFAAHGHSIRVARTIIEVSVLILGYFLGGSVGVGTVAYAICIGPLVHVFLPRLSLPAPVPRTRADKGATCNS